MLEFESALKRGGAATERVNSLCTLLTFSRDLNASFLR